MTDTNTTTPLTAENRPVSLTVRDIDRELSQGVPIPGRNGEPPLREDDRTKHELLTEIDRLAARVAQLEAPAAGLTAERIAEIEQMLAGWGIPEVPIPLVDYMGVARDLLAAHRAQAAEIEALKAARNRAHLEGRRAILDETDALRQRAEKAEADLAAERQAREALATALRDLLEFPLGDKAVLSNTGLAGFPVLSSSNDLQAAVAAARAALKAAKEGGSGV